MFDLWYINYIDNITSINTLIITQSFRKIQFVSICRQLGACVFIAHAYVFFNFFIAKFDSRGRRNERYLYETVFSVIMRSYIKNCVFFFLVKFLKKILTSYNACIWLFIIRSRIYSSNLRFILVKTKQSLYWRMTF